jgi:hypothetical protein
LLLEDCRDQLLSPREFDTDQLERDLLSLWSIGVLELKAIMIEMVATERYREVAAYYMDRSSDGVGVVG